MTKAALMSIALAMLAIPLTSQCQENVDDPWVMVRTLEGHWEGEGTGFGQSSAVSHNWEFVINDKFLRLSTKSVSAMPSGESELHEDVGYVSWSEAEGVLRFRQFISEGFVNTFTLKAVDSTELGIDFHPEDTEGMASLSVGMTLRFVNVDTYEMVLAMGKKGSELKACQTIRMQRVD